MTDHDNEWLASLIAQERLAPPAPAPDRAHAGWIKLCRSVAVASPVINVDLPDGLAQTASAGKAAAAGKASGIGTAKVMGMLGSSWVAKSVVVVALVSAGSAAKTLNSTGPEQETTATSAQQRPQVHTVARVPVFSLSPAPAGTHELTATEITPPSEELPPPSIAPATATPTDVPALEPHSELPFRARAMKPRPASAPSLVQESRLIRSAYQALASHEPTRARDQLTAHTRLFPDGSMAEEREALHIACLCQLGEHSQADARLRRFTRRWPTSLHIGFVRASCPAE